MVCSCCGHLLQAVEKRWGAWAGWVGLTAEEGHGRWECRSREDDRVSLAIPRTLCGRAYCPPHRFGPCLLGSSHRAVYLCGLCWSQSCITFNQRLHSMQVGEGRGGKGRGGKGKEEEGEGQEVETESSPPQPSCPMVCEAHRVVVHIVVGDFY